MLQGLVCGSRPDAFGIEALVEHQTLVISLVVQIEIAVGTMNLAHSGVGTYFIYDLPCCILHRVFHVVKVGRLGTPQLGFLDGEHHTGTIHGRGCLGGYHFPCVKHLHGKCIAVGLAIELRTNDKLLLVDIGNGKHILQGLGADGLHPHRLPDAGGTGVVATARIVVPALLAAWLHASTQIVINANHQIGALAGWNILGDVHLETAACAKVLHDLLAVDIDGSLVIYCTEVQQHPLAFPLGRDADGALIPHGVDEICVFHAAELALGAEGNGYLAVETLAVAEVAVDA